MFGLYNFLEDEGDTSIHSHDVISKLARARACENFGSLSLHGDSGGDSGIIDAETAVLSLSLTLSRIYIFKLCGKTLRALFMLTLCPRFFFPHTDL